MTVAASAAVQLEEHMAPARYILGNNHSLALTEWSQAAKGWDRLQQHRPKNKSTTQQKKQKKLCIRILYTKANGTNNTQSLTEWPQATDGLDRKQVLRENHKELKIKKNDKKRRRLL